MSDETTQSGQVNTGVTGEQLAAAIEQAKVSERAIAAKQLEEARKKIEEAEALLKAKEGEVSSLSDKVSKLSVAVESVKEKGGTKILDVEKLTEELSNKIAERTQSDMADLQGKLATMEKALQQKELEEFRQHTIKANGGESNLVVELVNGSSKEQILQSVDLARSVFDKIRGGRTQGQHNPNTTPNANQTPITNAPPTVPSSNVGPVTGGGALNDVRSLSNADYAKTREERLRAAANAQMAAFRADSRY
jgi:hypothetical protein